VSDVTSPDAHARVVAFMAAEASDRAGLRIDGPDGLFAVVDERWPLSHDSNKVVAPGPVAPDVLLDFTDEALGRAGVGHRQILILDAVTGETTAPVAVARDYAVSRIVLMALPADVIDAPDPAIDARVVDEPTVRRLLARIWPAEPPEVDDETVGQLVQRRDAYQTAGRVIPFVAYEDGVPVAHTDVRLRGDVAEIDAVATLPAHRNRGYARALVLTAVAAGRSAGADLVFLQADADDWPRDLYSRLGFVVIGTTYEMHRSAP
jgi:GNAT superfamily N-acetyltransferase